MVPLDFSTYGPVILATLVGFFGLAALLLVPVYRFLVREEKISARWTNEPRSRAREESDGTDGAAQSTET
jgi:hypothetical protein